MDNHDSPIQRTPGPNLSHSTRWLHVTDASRFNRCLEKLARYAWTMYRGSHAPCRWLLPGCRGVPMNGRLCAVPALLSQCSLRLAGIAPVVASAMTAVSLGADMLPVSLGPPLNPRFETELITDTAGYTQRGGTGRSSWGFNQSNIVRHGDDVYAMCWRDDLHLVVFRRVKQGQWEASPPLPRVPQNGVLLVDSKGRVHVIAGESASYHARFDPPGQIRTFSVQQFARADTRFGAGIDAGDNILVAGGLPGMSWYVLGATNGYRPAAQGRVAHEKGRAYYFVAYRDGAGHAFCYDDYFVKGSGYHTLRTYYYWNPNLVQNPEGWTMQTISDVSDTIAGAARGATENEDLLLDRAGRVHFLYLRNPTPGTGEWSWATDGQKRSDDALYHAVGRPEGPFTHHRLGNFSRGRLHETPDGRLHYFLCRGEWFRFELWYAVGEINDPGRISEPVRLMTPTPIDHVFINSTRAGGKPSNVIDCYFTGPYPGETRHVYYGRLTPGREN